MKVLIVGLGSIGKKHINALRKVSSDVLIYALRSSPNAEANDGVTNIFNITEIKNLAIDFVIIANPTAKHRETISDLLPFQIPLFIEKPLFDDLHADSGKILYEIKDKNIRTYVACNLRFLGCIRFTKDFIRGKRINEVNSYCGSYLPDWRPGQDFRNGYSANKEMGGGVHLDLIHEIDYLYWLFGRPINVNSFKSNKSSLRISSVDYANYLLEYPQFSANIILNYYRLDAKRSLEIVFDDGTLNVDLLKNCVTFRQEIIYSSNKSLINTYEDQLRFFVEQTLHQDMAFNTVDEAFEILQLCIN